jgi:transcriptional regulator with XRE-family HTH domain
VLYCNVGANYQLESGLRVITGAQLRAARGLLNLSISELSERTGLAINTIRRAEGTNAAPPITAANAKLLTSAFEVAGVLFIPSGDLGPGVRLKTSEPVPIQPRRREKSKGK